MKKSRGYWVVVVSFLWFLGCFESETLQEPVFLIKTVSMGITPEEFEEELDLKKAAYPYNIHENPAEFNEMVILLVNMLSEEIILLNAAKDKGIAVTDQELQSAVEVFKKDYPEDSFEKLILKNAISYTLWENRFKKNMIIKKIIDQELSARIEIQPDEMISFFHSYQVVDLKEKSDKTKLDTKKIKDEKELVEKLRRQKSEDQYDEWMQSLSIAYPVEINREKLKIFLLSIEKTRDMKNEMDN